MMAGHQKTFAAVALGAWAIAWAAPSSALADASLVIQNADPPGVGFNDVTEVQPVGGNAGETLGRQRLNAVQHAADIWGALLDSPVPIVIEARFSGLGCAQDGTAELARASPLGAAVGLDAADADPEIYYPAALANRLAGEDLFEGAAEIVAEFNGDLDSPDCIPEFKWYYGLDGDCGFDADLVTTALHELAHGLGVIHLVDLETGALLDGFGDHFSVLVLDNSLDKRWPAMTDAERVASATNVRQVVWDGPNVTAQAAVQLASGAPKLEVTPEPPGFTGFVAEANFGALVSSVSVETELVLGFPRNGCAPLADASGKVVLLFEDGCNVASMARFAYDAGAAGVVIAARDPWDAPPASLEVPDETYDLLDLQELDIPCLGIAESDALLLEGTLADQSVTVTMASDAARLVGADAAGRVLLSATRPALVGTSIAHWDTLARPNLLMEPLNRHDASQHHVDLTWALLQDMGWSPFCGNGRLDAQEQCDDGQLNSDTAADACRTDCLNAHCGDGVTDTGEQCDQGHDNSDSVPDACRASCENPHCGDGIVDTGEQCDQGQNNDDDAPDACRTDCQWAARDDAGSDARQRFDAGSCCGPADAQRPDGCNAQCAPTAPDAEGGIPSSEDAGPGHDRDGRTRPARDSAVPTSGDGAIGPSESNGGCGCHLAGGRATTASVLLFLLFLWTALVPRLAARRRNAGRR